MVISFCVKSKIEDQTFDIKNCAEVEIFVKSLRNRVWCIKNKISRKTFIMIKHFLSHFDMLDANVQKHLDDMDPAPENFMQRIDTMAFERADSREKKRGHRLPSRSVVNNPDFSRDGVGSPLRGGLAAKFREKQG